MRTLSPYATVEERIFHAVATMTWPRLSLALRWRKVGGLTFIRVGRLQMTFCRVKRA